MSRPKKKPNYNPDQVMQEFMAAVADAFGSYDDREDTCILRMSRSVFTDK